MPSYDQGYVTGAKQGTVYYGDGGSTWSNLATDDSQEGTNMTAGSNWMYSTSDARFDVTGPRTIYQYINIDNNDSGYLFYLGTSGTETAIEADGAGGIRLVHEGSVLGSLTLTSSGTTRGFHTAWVTEPNPDTTGASDAYISWLIAWDVTNATALRAGPWTHSERTSDDTFVAWGASTAAGANNFTGRFVSAAFHHRAQTLTEIYADHVSAPGALTTDVETAPEALPYTLAMGLGDRNQLHGPAMAWAARNHHQLRRRLVTGRTIRLAPQTLTSSTHSSNQWFRSAVGSTDYRWFLGGLYALPVPPTCSHLWVRMHCDLWVTSGAAVPTGLRVYSANRPPTLQDATGAEPYDHRYIGSVVTRDDGASGSGSWTVEGLLQIRRSQTDPLRAGFTYIMPAYAFDPASASGNDANARLIINAIQLAPCTEVPDQGDELGELA